jgi:hypothetical protein
LSRQINGACIVVDERRALWFILRNQATQLRAAPCKVNVTLRYEHTMIKSLFGSLASKEPDAPATPGIDAARLAMLHQNFAIGKKLAYFPEFMREVVFPTFILAYRINGQFIYSDDAVLCDEHGVPYAFQVNPKTRLPLAELASLQMLLPDTTDLEKTLDYFTRAELGRAGQFRVGNTITLFSETEGRGVPTVDTRVERRQTMNSGPYSGNSTVLVTPDFDTLALGDKRRKPRVTASVPVALFHGVADEPYACTLCDFSEQTVRLSRGDAQPMPTFAEGAHIDIEFYIQPTAPPHRLRVIVQRRDDEACIARIDRVYRNGVLQPLRLMDIMEIKTGLLNRHPV